MYHVYLVAIVTYWTYSPPQQKKKVQSHGSCKTLHWYLLEVCTCRPCHALNWETRPYNTKASIKAPNCIQMPYGLDYWVQRGYESHKCKTFPTPAHIHLDHARYSSKCKKIPHSRLCGSRRTRNSPYLMPSLNISQRVLEITKVPNLAYTP